MTDPARAGKEAPAGDRPPPTLTPPAFPPDALRARPPYDVYSRLCPTRLVLDRVADKWSVLVLARLAQGPRRFNGLRREVDGVSAKVLAQVLRGLERDGLVSRRAFATVPVTVEYRATPLGLTLAEPVAAVARWAEAHMDEVAAARAAFDRQASRATT